MSPCVELLGARVLTVEVGMYQYGMGEGKKEPVGMDWNWRYWYELMISIEVCVCIWTRTYVMYVCLLYVCTRIHTWVYVCISSIQILFSNNILPFKGTRVPQENG